MADATNKNILKAVKQELSFEVQKHCLWKSQTIYRLSMITF